jgi:hypothetical protein
VHRAQAPDQWCRVQPGARKWGFSVGFLGTYSAFAGAALCKVERGKWPIRCDFAIETAGCWALHRAVQGMPYADALLNLSHTASRDVT